MIVDMVTEVVSIGFIEKGPAECKLEGGVGVRWPCGRLGKEHARQKEQPVQRPWVGRHASCV